MSILGQSAGLIFKIDGDSSALQKELKGVDASFSSLGGKMSTIGGAASIAAAGVGLIATAAAAGAAALYNLTAAAAEYAGAIFDAKEKTGLSAAALSTWKLNADNAGSSLEQVTASAAKFAKTLDAAKNGNKEAQATMKALGVTTYDLDEALAQTTQTIFNAAEGTEQLALAQKAFGKSGADMLPVIKQMGGDLKAATKEAERLGIMLTEKDIAAADAFGDALGILSAQAKAAGVAFTSDLMVVMAKYFTMASQWYAQNKAEVRAWGSTIAMVVGDFARGVGVAFNFIQNNAAALRVALAGITFGMSEIVARAYEMLNAYYRARGLKAGGEAQEGSGMAAGGGGFAAPSGGGSRGGGGGGGGAAKDAAAEAEKLRREAVDAAQLAVSRTLEIYKKGYDEKQALLDAQLTHEEISIKEHLRDTGRLKIEAVMDEKRLTEQLLANDKIVLNDKEKAELLQKLKVLTIELRIERLKAADVITEAIKKETEAESKALEVEQKRLQAIKDRRGEALKEDLDRRKAELESRTAGATLDGGGFSGGLAGAIGIMGDAALKARDKAAAAANGIKASWMSMGSAVMGGVDQMVQGLGSMVEAWVLYGSAGPNAMRKMVASVLAGVAAQSAVLAIFELAKGFAALFWNPAEAGAHFTAAALFGGLAVGTAIAGRAIAGDSFNQQTDRATGGSSSSASNNRSGNGQVFSSNPDAVNEGGINQTPSRGIASNITLTIKTTKDHIVDVVKSNIAGNGSLRTAIQDAAV